MVCIRVLVVWGLMLCSHHCILMFQWNMLPPSSGPFLNKACVSPVPVFSTTPIFFFSVFHLSPVTSCGSYKAAFYPHISLCYFFWPKLGSFSLPPSVDFLAASLYIYLYPTSLTVGGSTFLQNIGIL